MTQHVVVGARGEVGKALHEVLSKEGPRRDRVIGVDFDGKQIAYSAGPTRGDVTHLHIAIRWGEFFVDTVQAYARELEPDIVVVHSTVPVGTCDEQGWVHSYVDGRHPDLAESVRRFDKVFAGPRAAEAADPWKRRGVRAVTLPTAAESEAAKILLLAHYGVEIAFEKYAYEWCMKHGVSPNLAYRFAHDIHNEGYTKMGQVDVRLSRLAHYDGEIGGHCVVPGVRLMDDDAVGAFVEPWT